MNHVIIFDSDVYLQDCIDKFCKHMKKRAKRSAILDVNFQFMEKKVYKFADMINYVGPKFYVCKTSNVLDFDYQ